MKKFAIAALAAIAAAVSFSGAAQASWCDDGYSTYHTASYRHHDYDDDYCYVKKVVYYDDYGYRHYKRVRICN